MKRLSGSWLPLLLLVVAAGGAQAQDYRVKAGDTLSGLAARFGVSVSAIQQANGLSTTRIRAGDILRIPDGNDAPAASSAPSSASSASSSAGTYEVRRNDTLSGIASKLGVSLDALLRANSLSMRSIIHPGQRLTVPGGGSPRVTEPPPAPVVASPRAVHAPMQVPESHVEVLARIVKGECWYDTPFDGMVAVAATVLNRVREGYGRNIPAVAHQSMQYSCYNPENRRKLYDGPIPDDAWRAARAALAGEDPSGGATHYYNPHLVRPRWGRYLTPTVRLGTDKRNTHAFFK